MYRPFTSKATADLAIAGYKSEILKVWNENGSANTPKIQNVFREIVRDVIGETYGQKALQDATFNFVQRGALHLCRYCESTTGNEQSNNDKL